MAKKKTTARSDNRYEVKVTIGKGMDGKIMRKSFYSTKSRSDAQKIADQWLTEHKAQSMLGEAEAPTKPEVSFAEWAQQWLSTYKYDHVKITTYRSSYERPVRLYIIPAFRNKMIDDILPIDIQRFMTKMEEELGQSMCSKIKLCLDGIFSTAIDNGLIDRNPSSNIKVQKRSIIPQKQIKRVYNQAQTESIIAFSQNHKYGLSVRLMLELGLRVSEMLGLKWEDIDTERKTIWIHRTVTSDDGRIIISDILKSDTSNRVLPISQSLADHVDKMRGRPDEYITHSTRPPYGVLDNKAFTNKRYHTFFENYKDSIKDPDFPVLTPHELRHTCGTYLYERTHDIYAVSKFLGHASIDITVKYYLHSNVEQLRDSLNVI